MMLFGWRVLARLEDRIIANADKAHAMIGENISKVEAKVDKVADDVSGLKVDVGILKNDAGWIKSRLAPDSSQ